MDYLELNKDLKYKIAHKRLANIICGFFFISPLFNWPCGYFYQRLPPLLVTWPCGFFVFKNYLPFYLIVHMFFKHRLPPLLFYCPIIKIYIISYTQLYSTRHLKYYKFQIYFFQEKVTAKFNVEKSWEIDSPVSYDLKCNI